MIYDFIQAALPFIIIGLVLAVFFAFRSKSNSENNYSTTGMALGMCFGSLLGTLEIVNIGIGLSLGMLIGLCFGSLIEKKKEH